MQTIDGLPGFQGGAAGLLSYDLARSLERVPPARCAEFDVPALAMGLYDTVIAFDHAQQQGWIIAQGWPEVTAQRRRERARRRQQELLRWLSRDPREVRPPAPSAERFDLSRFAPQFPVDTPPGLLSNFSAAGYLQAVEAAIEYIRAGDVFQVNLAQRLVFPALDDAVSLYLRLRQRNPATFAAYFDLGEIQIVSASPERFLRVDHGRVETRPIKGTRPRTHRPEADLFSRDELQQSEKDRAENVMIVDLLRNDLSRVCHADSVRVEQLCAVESYEYVQHLVSVIRGQLEPPHASIDLVRAAFPGGSITGAPESARDGNHRRTGTARARCVLRVAGLPGCRRRNGSEHPDSHGDGRARLVATAGRRGDCGSVRSAARICGNLAQSGGLAARRDEVSGPPSERWSLVTSRRPTMILLIDNYDSFVHNLARYLRRLGQETRVIRNDQVRADDVRQMAAQALVLSPGPKSPREAGGSLELVQQLWREIPILGVCLGHQIIAAAFGATIVPRVSRCTGAPARSGIKASGLFAGLPSPLCVARYHSLVVDPTTLPPELVATAHTGDGTLMALEHRVYPVVGWQFHPESILTSHGYALLAAFLQRVELPVSQPLPSLSDEQSPPAPGYNSLPGRILHNPKRKRTGRDGRGYHARFPESPR